MLCFLGVPAHLVELLAKQELKTVVKGTHIFARGSKKSHKNNAVRFTCVLAAGTTCWVIIILKQ